MIPLDPGILVKPGTSLAAAAARQAWKRWWNWRRQVTSQVAKQAAFPVQKRLLRKALKGDDVLRQLSPADVAAAADTVAHFRSILEQSPDWAGLSATEMDARSLEIVALVQRTVLTKLDPSTAVATADAWSADRDAATQSQLAGVHDSVREVLNVVTATDELEAILLRLPPPLADFIRITSMQRPQLARFARALANSDRPTQDLQDWVRRPVAWFSDESSGDGWIAVGLALAGYGRPAEAAEALLRGVDLGVPNNSSWRALAAFYLATGNSDLSRSCASAAGSGEPLACAVLAALAADWQEVERVLGPWEPRSAHTADIRAMMLADAVLAQGHPDAAMAVLVQRERSTATAGVLMALSRLLVQRAQLGRSNNRDSDLHRAADLAVAARDRRRRWRGDSAEPTVAAAEALVFAHDTDTALSLLNPEPAGQATAAEHADSRVQSAIALFTADSLTAEGGPRAEDEVQQRWRTALDSAVDEDHRVMAARGLLLAGGLDERIDTIRADHPEALRDIDEVIEAESNGPEPGRIARLKTMRTRSPFAVIRLSEILMGEGRAGEAGDELRDAADRFDDQHLKLMAASAFLEARDFTAAGSAAKEALAASSSRWSGRLRANRIAAGAAAEAGDWAGVIPFARQALELIEDTDLRWVLVLALQMTDEPAKAWEALHAAGKVIPAESPQRFLLRLHLVGLFGTPEDLAHDTVAALQAFPLDEEYSGRVVSNFYGRRAEAHAQGRRVDEVDPGLQLRLKELTDTFVQQFPDSPHFKVLSLSDGDTADEILAKVTPHIAPGADERRDIELQVAEGRLPAGMLSAVHGKPYAEVFIRRAGGGLHVCPINPAERLTDQRDAFMHAEAGFPDTLIDASALHVLALLPQDVRDVLMGVQGSLLISTHASRDLVETRDKFAMRSTLTVSFDPEEGRPYVASISEEQAELLLTRAQQMIDLSQAARRLTPRPVIPPRNQRDARFDTWFGAIGLCKETSSALWTDDSVLRQIARSEGLRAIGTPALIATLVAHERLSSEQEESALRALASNFAVDLPPNFTRLRSIAEDENWQPGAVAFALSRPITWSAGPTECLSLLHEACAHCVDDVNALAYWTHHAVYGATGASTNTDTARELAATLITSLMLKRRGHPDAARAVATGGRGGARARGLPDPWTDVVTNLHHWILEVLEGDEAAAAQELLDLVSAFEDHERIEAARVAFDPERL